MDNCSNMYVAICLETFGKHRRKRPLYWDRPYRRGPSLMQLPPELVDLVVEFVSLDRFHRRTLLNLREVCRGLEPVARRYAFRAIRILGSNHINTVVNFVRIARTERLRLCVRDVHIDTFGGPFQDRRTYFRPNLTFMIALPYLRFMQNLKTCHVSFSHAGLPYSRRRTRRDYSLWVLDVMLNCLAGTWTNERQLQVDEVLKVGPPRGWYGDGELECAKGIPVEKLTFSEMVNPVDRRSKRSQAWRDLLESCDGTLRSLANLKVYVVEDFFVNDRHSALEAERCLTQGWMSTQLQARLRNMTISWRGPAAEVYPILRMPRWKEGVTNPNDFFPCLTTLMITRYAFSSRVQTDWVTHVGHGEGYNGLEELYLDECRILWHDVPEEKEADINTNIITITNPITNTTKTITITNNPNQETNTNADKKASDKKDKAKEAVLRVHRKVDRLIRPPKGLSSPLRWYQVFCRWATRMTGLKKFDMSSSAGTVMYNADIARTIAPHVALVSRILEDDNKYEFRRNSTIYDFDISPPLEDVANRTREWTRWCDEVPWRSTGYVRESEIVRGVQRSVECASGPAFYDPWLGDDPAVGWENEDLVRLFDEAAMLHLQRNIWRRAHNV